MVKQHNKRFKLSPVKLASIVLVSSLMAWIVYAASAATGSITAASDKTSVTQNDTFTVTVTETSDTQVSVVNAKVTFDPSKVTMQSIDYTGSPFTTNGPESAVGSGFVTVNRFLLDGQFPTGSNVVAKIVFKATASSGSAAIGVDKASSMLVSYNNPADILSTVTGTSVSLKSPAVPTSPQTPPTSNPASPTSSSSSSSSSSSPSASTSSPSQSSGSSTDSSTTSPTITPESNTNYNYSSPAQKSIAPGTSVTAVAPSLTQRLLKLVRTLLPVVFISAVVGGLLWFILKKIHEHPYGFSGATVSSSGVGSVKPPTGSVLNKPGADKQVIGKPASPTSSAVSAKPDPDDHTPHTFSGI